MTKEQQKENRKIWVAALRSGDYRQGMNALRLGDCYCVMGVLCDVSNLGGWKRIKDSVVQSYSVNGNSSSHMIPDAVRDWVGLRSNSGYSMTAYSLIGFNDVEQMNFSDLADFIESEPEGLFLT